MLMLVIIAVDHTLNLYSTPWFLALYDCPRHINTQLSLFSKLHYFNICASQADICLLLNAFNKGINASIYRHMFIPQPGAGPSTGIFLPWSLWRVRNPLQKACNIEKHKLLYLPKKVKKKRKRKKSRQTEKVRTALNHKQVSLTSLAKILHILVHEIHVHIIHPADKALKSYLGLAVINMLLDMKTMIFYTVPADFYANLHNVSVIC